jgi:magnesium-transporting ATPase (P-type)
VLEVTIISVISFFACLPLILNLDIEPLFIVFEFFHFLASAAPPPLPIFFHVAYSFSLTRLKFKEISGTEPQKTVDGAYLKIMCFDKTGTLT